MKIFQIHQIFATRDTTKFITISSRKFKRTIFLKTYIKLSVSPKIYLMNCGNDKKKEKQKIKTILKTFILNYLSLKCRRDIYLHLTPVLTFLNIVFYVYMPMYPSYLAYD